MAEHTPRRTENTLQEDGNQGSLGLSSTSTSTSFVSSAKDNISKGGLQGTVGFLVGSLVGSLTKRNGSLQPIDIDKVLRRLQNAARHSMQLRGLPVHEAWVCECSESLARLVVHQCSESMSTLMLDELLTVQCAYRASVDVRYGYMASYLALTQHYKQTPVLFSDSIQLLSDAGVLSPLVHPFVMQHRAQLDAAILHDRDLVNVDYFGFKTLETLYLCKLRNGRLAERPQHLWMRVAVGVHLHDIAGLAHKETVLRSDPSLKEEAETQDKTDALLASILRTYQLMSTKQYIHATPTLFNACKQTPQLSSCYLVALEEDSISGIYHTLYDCAQISKFSGGVGLHIHNLRAAQSYIQGTQGTTSSLASMLKVFNATARYVNQAGKRNGSFAVYLEPWHADVLDLLQMRTNRGDEERKARDLFYALWIPDLFMQRVKQDGMWCLMSPDDCPGLDAVFGPDFDTLYTAYEQQGKYRSSMRAQDLWTAILDTQMETGSPYLLYKDAVNRKSNQANVGVIRSSNLCCEIMEYSDAQETAVCNLASLALPSFVRYALPKEPTDGTAVTASATKKPTVGNEFCEEEGPREPRFPSTAATSTAAASAHQEETDAADTTTEFKTNETKPRPFVDYEALHQVAYEVAQVLDKVIDVNAYPTENSRRSNMRHRPLGMGVQGLADLFALLRVSFDSEEARQCNQRVFETIYHAALSASNDLARVHGPYATFAGSPASKGTLQFDLWGVTPTDGRYDWAALKASIQQHGLRNSLSVALMPTASTSQILGCNECFEPFTSNLYSRRTLAGEFIVVNQHLQRELTELGVWNETVKNDIIARSGSVQDLEVVPLEVRQRYKTVWEMSMRTLIDMSADRGAFVCQSQSLNLWVANPTPQNLTAMLFYGWSKGLKTGLYYLRRKARHTAQQFTIPPPTTTQLSVDSTATTATTDRNQTQETNTQDQHVCLSCSA